MLNIQGEIRRDWELRFWEHCINPYKSLSGYNKAEMRGSAAAQRDIEDRKQIRLCNVPGLHPHPTPSSPMDARETDYFGLLNISVLSEVYI